MSEKRVGDFDEQPGKKLREEGHITIFVSSLPDEYLDDAAFRDLFDIADGLSSLKISKAGRFAFFNVSSRSVGRKVMAMNGLTVGTSTLQVKITEDTLPQEHHAPPPRPRPSYSPNAGSPNHSPQMAVSPGYQQQGQYMGNQNAAYQYAPLGTLRCHVCQQVGHKATDCAYATCHRCGQMGHKQWECPQNRTPSSGPNTNPTLQYGNCHVCQQPGHKASACQFRTCHGCGQAGHSIANCPSGARNPQLAYGNCHQCNQPGHKAANCPESTCKACGGKGHWANSCPTTQGGGFSNPSFAQGGGNGSVPQATGYSYNYSEAAPQ